MDDHGLDQRESLAGAEGIVRNHLLNLGVPHDDPLEAVPDVDERVVLIGRALALKDQPVFHDDAIGPTLGPGEQREDGAHRQRDLETTEPCRIRPHAAFPRAGADVGPPNFDGSRKWACDAIPLSLTLSLLIVTARWSRSSQRLLDAPALSPIHCRDRSWSPRLDHNLKITLPKTAFDSIRAWASRTSSKPNAESTTGRTVPRASQGTT